MIYLRSTHRGLVLNSQVLFQISKTLEQTYKIRYIKNGRFVEIG